MMFAGNLVPSVFRNRDPIDEFNLLESFRHYAPSRHHSCPHFNEKPAWLAMAQHYGVPTRLLDWTDSILNAVFFAVRKPEDIATRNKDGIVFALDLLKVNERTTKQRGMISLTGLAMESPPETGQYQLFHDAFSHEKKVKKPLYAVVRAPQVDRRLVAQQGLFTIHNCGIPLEQQDGYKELCIEFRIPSTAKGTLKKDLNALGINEMNLFPDLDNLAYYLSSVVFPQKGI